MSRLVSVVCSAAIATATELVMSPCADAAKPTTADCLHASNSSVELRNDSKLQAARDQLLVCAAKSCPADIRKECLRRVDEVTAAIPTIIFEAKDAAWGMDLSAVKVTMDGQPFAERLEGTALSVDPGSHNFRFEAAGQAPVEKPFVIREGEKDRRERIMLGEPPPPPPKEKAPDPLQPPPSPPKDPGLGTQKILAIVAGSVGLVGAGVGSFFGVVAMSKKSDAQSVCPNSVCADQNGVNRWSDAKSTAQISDIAFIVSGAALAGGAILWLTAEPKSAGAPARVGIGPGTVQLRGAW